MQVAPEPSTVEMLRHLILMVFCRFIGIDVTVLYYSFRNKALKMHTFNRGPGLLFFTTSMPGFQLDQLCPPGGQSKNTWAGRCFFSVQYRYGVTCSTSRARISVSHSNIVERLGRVLSKSPCTSSFTYVPVKFLFTQPV